MPGEIAILIPAEIVAVRRRAAVRKAYAICVPPSNTVPNVTCCHCGADPMYDAVQTYNWALGTASLWTGTTRKRSPIWATAGSVFLILGISRSCGNESRLTVSGRDFLEPLPST